MEGLLPAPGNVAVSAARLPQPHRRRRSLAVRSALRSILCEPTRNLAPPLPNSRNALAPAHRKPPAVFYFHEEHRGHNGSGAAEGSQLLASSSSDDFSGSDSGDATTSADDSDGEDLALPRPGYNPALPAALRHRAREAYVHPEAWTASFAPFVPLIEKGDLHGVMRRWRMSRLDYYNSMPQEHRSHPLLVAVHHFQPDIAAFFVAVGLDRDVNGKLHPYSGDNLSSEAGELQRVNACSLWKLLYTRNIIEGERTRLPRLLKEMQEFIVGGGGAGASSSSSSGASSAGRPAAACRSAAITHLRTLRDLYASPPDAAAIKALRKTKHYAPFNTAAGALPDCDADRVPFWEGLGGDAPLAPGSPDPATVDWEARVPADSGGAAGAVGGPIREGQRSGKGGGRSACSEAEPGAQDLAALEHDPGAGAHMDLDVPIAQLLLARGRESSDPLAGGRSSSSAPMSMFEAVLGRGAAAAAAGGAHPDPRRSHAAPTLSPECAPAVAAIRASKLVYAAEDDIGKVVFHLQQLCAGKASSADALPPDYTVPGTDVNVAAAVSRCSPLAASPAGVAALALCGGGPPSPSAAPSLDFLLLHAVHCGRPAIAQFLLGIGAGSPMGQGCVLPHHDDVCSPRELERVTPLQLARWMSERRAASKQVEDRKRILLAKQLLQLLEGHLSTDGGGGGTAAGKVPPLLATHMDTVSEPEGGMDAKHAADAAGEGSQGDPAGEERPGSPAFDDEEVPMPMDPPAAGASAANSQPRRRARKSAHPLPLVKVYAARWNSIAPSVLSSTATLAAASKAGAAGTAAHPRGGAAAGGGTGSPLPPNKKRRRRLQQQRRGAGDVGDAAVGWARREESSDAGSQHASQHHRSRPKQSPGSTASSSKQGAHRSWRDHTLSRREAVAARIYAEDAPIELSSDSESGRSEGGGSRVSSPAQRSGRRAPASKRRPPPRTSDDVSSGSGSGDGGDRGNGQRGAGGGSRKRRRGQQNRRRARSASSSSSSASVSGRGLDRPSQQRGPRHSSPRDAHFRSRDRMLPRPEHRHRGGIGDDDDEDADAGDAHPEFGFHLQDPEFDSGETGSSSGSSSSLSGGGRGRAATGRNGTSPGGVAGGGSIPGSAFLVDDIGIHFRERIDWFGDADDGMGGQQRSSPTSLQAAHRQRKGPVPQRRSTAEQRQQHGAEGRRHHHADANARTLAVGGRAAAAPPGRLAGAPPLSRRGVVRQAILHRFLGLQPPPLSQQQQQQQRALANSLRSQQQAGAHSSATSSSANSAVLLAAGRMEQGLYDANGIRRTAPPNQSGSGLGTAAKAGASRGAVPPAAPPALPSGLAAHREHTGQAVRELLVRQDQVLRTAAAGLRETRRVAALQRWGDMLQSELEAKQRSLAALGVQLQTAASAREDAALQRLRERIAAGKLTGVPPAMRMMLAHRPAGSLAGRQGAAAHASAAAPAAPPSLLPQQLAAPLPQSAGIEGGSGDGASAGPSLLTSGHRAIPSEEHDIAPAASTAAAAVAEPREQSAVSHGAAQPAASAPRPAEEVDIYALPTMLEPTAPVTASAAVESASTTMGAGLPHPREDAPPGSVGETQLVYHMVLPVSASPLVGADIRRDWPNPDISGASFWNGWWASRTSSSAPGSPAELAGCSILVVQPWYGAASFASVPLAAALLEVDGAEASCPLELPSLLPSLPLPPSPLPASSSDSQHACPGPPQQRLVPRDPHTADALGELQVLLDVVRSPGEFVRQQFTEILPLCLAEMHLAELIAAEGVHPPASAAPGLPTLSGEGATLSAALGIPAPEAGGVAAVHLRGIACALSAFSTHLREMVGRDSEEGASLPPLHGAGAAAPSASSQFLQQLLLSTLGALTVPDPGEAHAHPATLDAPSSPPGIVRADLTVGIRTPWLHPVSGGPLFARAVSWSGASARGGRPGSSANHSSGGGGGGAAHLLKSFACFTVFVCAWIRENATLLLHGHEADKLAAAACVRILVFQLLQLLTDFPACALPASAVLEVGTADPSGDAGAAVTVDAPLLVAVHALVELFACASTACSLIGLQQSLLAEALVLLQRSPVAPSWTSAFVGSGNLGGAPFLLGDARREEVLCVLADLVGATRIYARMAAQAPADMPDCAFHLLPDNGGVRVSEDRPTASSSALVEDVSTVCSAAAAIMDGIARTPMWANGPTAAAPVLGAATTPPSHAWQPPSHSRERARVFSQRCSVLLRKVAARVVSGKTVQLHFEDAADGGEDAEIPQLQDDARLRLHGIALVQEHCGRAGRFVRSALALLVNEQAQQHTPPLPPTSPPAASSQQAQQRIVRSFLAAVESAQNATIAAASYPRSSYVSFAQAMHFTTGGVAAATAPFLSQHHQQLGGKKPDLRAAYAAGAPPLTLAFVPRLMQGALPVTALLPGLRPVLESAIQRIARMTRATADSSSAAAVCEDLNRTAAGSMACLLPDWLMAATVSGELTEPVREVAVAVFQDWQQQEAAGGGFQREPAGPSAAGGAVFAEKDILKIVDAAVKALHALLGAGLSLVAVNVTVSSSSTQPTLAAGSSVAAPSASSSSSSSSALGVLIGVAREHYRNARSGVFSGAPGTALVRYTSIHSERVRVASRASKAAPSALAHLRAGAASSSFAAAAASALPVRDSTPADARTYIPVGAALDASDALSRRLASHAALHHALSHALLSTFMSTAPNKLARAIKAVDALCAELSDAVARALQMQAAWATAMFAVHRMPGFAIAQLFLQWLASTVAATLFDIDVRAEALAQLEGRRNPAVVLAAERGGGSVGAAPQAQAPTAPRPTTSAITKPVVMFRNLQPSAAAASAAARMSGGAASSAPASTASASSSSSAAARLPVASPISPISSHIDSARDAAVAEWAAYESSGQLSRLSHDLLLQDAAVLQLACDAARSLVEAETVRAAPTNIASTLWDDVDLRVTRVQLRDSGPRSTATSSFPGLKFNLACALWFPFALSCRPDRALGNRFNSNTGSGSRGRRHRAAAASALSEAVQPACIAVLHLLNTFLDAPQSALLLQAKDAATKIPRAVPAPVAVKAGVAAGVAMQPGGEESNCGDALGPASASKGAAAQSGIGPNPTNQDDDEDDDMAWGGEAELAAAEAFSAAVSQLSKAMLTHAASTSLLAASAAQVCYALEHGAVAPSAAPDARRYLPFTSLPPEPPAPPHPSPLAPSSAAAHGATVTLEHPHYPFAPLLALAEGALLLAFSRWRTTVLAHQSSVCLLGHSLGVDGATAAPLSLRIPAAHIDALCVALRVGAAQQLAAQSLAGGDAGGGGIPGSFIGTPLSEGDGEEEEEEGDAAGLQHAVMLGRAALLVSQLWSLAMGFPLVAGCHDTVAPAASTSGGGSSRLSGGAKQPKGNSLFAFLDRYCSHGAERERSPLLPSLWDAALPAAPGSAPPGAVIPPAAGQQQQQHLFRDEGIVGGILIRTLLSPLLLASTLCGALGSGVARPVGPGDLHTPASLWAAAVKSFKATCSPSQLAVHSAGASLVSYLNLSTGILMPMQFEYQRVLLRTWLASAEAPSPTAATWQMHSLLTACLGAVFKLAFVEGFSEPKPAGWYFKWDCMWWVWGALQRSMLAPVPLDSRGGKLPSVTDRLASRRDAILQRLQEYALHPPPGVPADKAEGARAVRQIVAASVKGGSGGGGGAGPAGVPLWVGKL